jgi:SAM-dependent methyltransferase
MYVRRHDAYAHAKYEVLLRWLHDLSSSPLRVLNVGCGSGELCLLLAEQGHHVLGVDPGAEYIARAQAQATAHRLSDCAFQVADLETIARDASQYDVVFSTDVIEHIADDTRAALQLSALVRPGGSLFITVPAGQYLFGHHDEQLGHYRRYALRQVARLLPADLEVKRMRYFGASLIPVVWLYSKLLRRYYPVAQTGNPDTNPVLARLTRLVLLGEQKIQPPFGTSCLVWATKKV